MIPPIEGFIRSEKPSLQGAFSKNLAIQQLERVARGIRDALTHRREDSYMKKDFLQTAKRTLSVVVFGCALTGIFGSLGCNTVHGLGQDIERGGEKTQDAADAVKRRM
jgi:predicted small secreted protein